MDRTERTRNVETNQKSDSMIEYASLSTLLKTSEAGIRCEFIFRGHETFCDLESIKSHGTILA